MAIVNTVLRAEAQKRCEINQKRAALFLKTKQNTD